MITGNENLFQIAETDRDLIGLFEKHGLGSYFESNNLNKIGKFLKLNTLLKSKNINSGNFIELLNKSLNKSVTPSNPALNNEMGNLHLSSMLPCGLRNPFKEYFESLVQENIGEYGDLNYLIEGNVNHELSYYPLLDNIEDLDELPDIIMASDVNNFFHRPFMERFIQKGVFSAYEPYKANSYLEKSGYSDPKQNFTMFTANMLVMVVDKEKLGKRKMPEKWSDLLADDFCNSIVMRGEDDFFCNAVMLPFYKDHGFDAIKKLAQNISAGLHPAEMVKMAGTDNEKSSTVYIMPYFFAKKIKKQSVEIIWPSDGAIASPVFILVKKDALSKHISLLELITSKNMGEMLKGRFFPSMHCDVTHETFPEPVKWLGWDFIYTNDIGKLKDDIRTEFMKIWTIKK